MCKAKLFLAAAICALAACDNYDTFTTDRSATLSFSADTIRFDTLLTTIPSSTQTLTIYNHGDKGLRIKTVALEGGPASPFRINVDGQDMSRTNTASLSDFEVRRRDSIVVRAEVTLPTNDSDTPRRVDDALVLTLESGVRQRVPLRVVGQDAYFLKAKTITADTTFSATRPVVIYDSLVVAPSATLTIPAGTRLLFHDGAALRVRGRLSVRGTLSAPVIFRTDRTDHIFDYLPYDRLPGRWEGVYIAPESVGNEIEYLDLHGANYGICLDSTMVDDSKLLLLNSRIHNLAGHGLDIKGCHVEVANTEISNTLGHCVWLRGGTSLFIHCTIAQFYPLSASRGDALNITNFHDNIYYPLHAATFGNCVITGYADDVIMGSWAPEDMLPEGTPQEANFLFHNCFLATISEDSPAFENIVYDIQSDNTPSKSDLPRHEDNFILMDTHAFLYDFTPVAKSPIRSTADPAISALYPLDRQGRSRTADGAPDAGCYEGGEN